MTTPSSDMEGLTPKQRAGQLGGKARARNAAAALKAKQDGNEVPSNQAKRAQAKRAQAKRAQAKQNPSIPKASEKTNKRKINLLLDELSDSPDELDEGPRKKRSMLEESSPEQTPPRVQIPKLEVSGTPSKNTFFPHIMTGTGYPLPVTIQCDDHKVYRLKHAGNPTNGETSFWEWLANVLEDVIEAVGFDAFGACTDRANKDFHLDLVAHLFPQLLTINGQLRYSKANPSELIVAKKNYREFLTAVKNNATRLLGDARDELANMNAPLTTSTFSRNLLRIIPRQPPTILEHEHRIQIDNHEATLAHTAEIVRQELMALGTLSSNYAEEAQKASMTLSTIYAALRHWLDPSRNTDLDTAPPSNTYTTSRSYVKEEPISESEDEGRISDEDIYQEAESEKGISTNNATPFISSNTGLTTPIPPSNTGMASPVAYFNLSRTGPTTPAIPSSTETIKPAASPSNTETIHPIAPSSSTGTINPTAPSSSTEMIHPTASGILSRTGPTTPTIPSSTRTINASAPSSSTETNNPTVSSSNLETTNPTGSSSNLETSNFTGSSSNTGTNHLTASASNTGTNHLTASASNTETIGPTTLSSSTRKVDPTTLSSTTGKIGPTTPSSRTGKINATAPSSSAGGIKPTARVNSSSTGTSGPPKPNPLALPEILIKELFHGHVCRCTDCDPGVMQRMYDQASAQLRRTQRAQLGAEEVEIIRQEIRDNETSDIRQKFQLKLEEEMREEKWQTERDALRDQLEKEMLPDLKKQAEQEVTSELREKVRAEVIEQQRAVNRQRMEESKKRVEEEERRMREAGWM